jgi:hypothetical protein
MTLPFRRRHNDHEASHDRARAIVAIGLVEPVEADDAAWLEAHLAGCLECRQDAAAYRADRELLRALRGRAPEPPRDLWARTASAIERETGRRVGPGRADAGSSPAIGQRRVPLRGRRLGSLPLGAASGVIVLLVVVAVSIFPRALGPLGSPSGSDVAGGTVSVQATPLAVEAVMLSWLQAAPDGTYQFMQASVREVCPPSRDGCAPLDTTSSASLRLSEPPRTVVFSPSREELVVVTDASSTGGANVVVVGVPTPPAVEGTPAPLDSGAPTGASPGTPPPTVAPTEPTVLPSPSQVVASLDPGASPEIVPSAPPGEGRTIASGVIVVGEAAYSPDGRWLAFAARPVNGESGPDLYLWRVGDERATAVTSDHRTFFSGWLGNRALASRVDPAGPPAVPLEGSPGPTEVATAAPAPTADPSASADPNASPAASPVPLEEHPVSFLFDPESGTSIAIAGTDVWHPTVDPTGQLIVYWSGTLLPDGTGSGWRLGTGRVVLDRWQNGSPVVTAAPAATGDPGGTGDPAQSPSSVPSAVPSGIPVESPPPVYGPAGQPVTLVEGPTPDVDAWFDPTGTRVAIWNADPADPNVGTLRLLVVDPLTGMIDPAIDPLPGVGALRGVSMDAGRLAWVTPPGQDGEGSHVQVLAWRGNEFGQVRTIDAEGLFVIR